MDYRAWAILSALFAGLTAVLAKKGVEDVSSNLALAIRVLVVAAAAWAIVVARQEATFTGISQKTWIYLTLSGLATGASWLCYFRALKSGPVSQVAPIDKLSFVVAVILGFVVLKEKVSTNTIYGCALIVAGVAVTLR